MFTRCDRRGDRLV